MGSWMKRDMTGRTNRAVRTGKLHAHFIEGGTLALGWASDLGCRGGTH